MTPFDKAIVALLGAIVTVAGTQPWGAVLTDPGLQTAITTGATALLVYYLPNRPTTPTVGPTPAPV